MKEKQGVKQMEVWVVFAGDFINVGEYSEWTWEFYGIYNSEEKAKEVVSSLEAGLEEWCETKYIVEKHFVQ